ncbi:hypothetical protein ACWC0C_42140 [Streptomyces sp. NPDC001709]
MSTTAASAATYDGGDVWNYGCHGYILKDSAHWAEAAVSGPCYISIDQTNKTTGGWAKPGGWYYYSTGDAYFADGVHGVTACITPFGSDFSYETCGPLVWS